MSAREPRRKRLHGSEELFRDTASEAVGPNPPPAGVENVSLELAPAEVSWIIDAIQLARFPEMHRSRPTMTHYEELGRLQDRLRALVEKDGAG